MSGAYVAKAAETSSLSVPPGWDIDWPFPGPYPPGYEPDFDLTMTAPTSMFPGGVTVDIDSELVDNESYETNEPDNGLTWTAAWGDTEEAVEIRSPGGEWMASVSESYANIDDYWGTATELQFNTEESDIGRTVVVSVSSTPFTGYDVSDVASIVVMIDVPSESCEEDCDRPEATGCIDDCSNAVAAAANPATTAIGSYNANACQKNPAAACTEAQRTAATDAGDAASLLRAEWVTLWSSYCTAVELVAQLTCELDELTCTLNEAEGSSQAIIDEIEADIAAKEAEITAAESDRDAKLVLADSKSDEADTKADESMALADLAAPHSCQYLFSSAPGTEALVDYACASLGPTCGGREPLRCYVRWYVQQKTNQTICAGGSHIGDWSTRMSGQYTAAGKPFVTYLPGCSGVPYYACSCYGACGSCVDGGACASGCTSSYVYDVRLLKYYPETTDEGETCC